MEDFWESTLTYLSDDFSDGPLPERTCETDGHVSMGVPKNGRFIRENPHLQWMITRGTPMASETPRWTRFFTANHGGNGGRTLEFRHQTFGDEPPRRPNIHQEDSSGFNLGIKTPKKTWSKSLPVGVPGSGMPQTFPKQFFASNTVVVYRGDPQGA